MKTNEAGNSTDKITMYRARDSSWRKPLVRLCVDRTSGSYVWIRGTRVAKQSEGTAICNNFRDAKQWLRNQLAGQIAHHQEAIEKLRQRLIIIEATDERDIPADENVY